jgi:hypothetical protein
VPSRNVTRHVQLCPLYRASSLRLGKNISQPTVRVEPNIKKTNKSRQTIRGEMKKIFLYPSFLIYLFCLTVFFLFLSICMNESNNFEFSIFSVEINMDVSNSRFSSSTFTIVNFSPKTKRTPERNCNFSVVFVSVSRRFPNVF